MDQSLWDYLKTVLVVTTAFVPIHQAAIEIYKLFGPKARRYWEELTYIIYGEEMRPKAVETWRRLGN